MNWQGTGRQLQPLQWTLEGLSLTGVMRVGTLLPPCPCLGFLIQHPHLPHVWMEGKPPLGFLCPRVEPSIAHGTTQQVISAPCS